MTSPNGPQRGCFVPKASFHSQNSAEAHSSHLATKRWSHPLPSVALRSWGRQLVSPGLFLGCYLVTNPSLMETKGFKNKE